MSASVSCVLRFLSFRNRGKVVMLLKLFCSNTMSQSVSQVSCLGFLTCLCFVTLCCLDEGESWKEELLALARSKQERTESELLCLRQVFLIILYFRCQ